MSTKLTTITTQYRKFNTNQVLTEKQLNEFLDYFEDQHHLARIGLSGVGIVCGFKLSFNQTDSSITITQGYGVTTDGDLIALQRKPDNTQEQANKILKSINLTSKTFTLYKEYDNEKVKYPRFYDGEDQIELFEIFDADDVDTVDLANYSNLKDLADLEDKVVLLYLECYSKTGDLCTALDCDNQGIEQVNKLRVLLLSSENAINYIAAPDVIYNKHDWYQTYLDLPEVAVGRDILSSENTKTFKRLKDVYYQSINNFDTVSNLSNGIDEIYKKLNSTGSSTLGTDITNIFSISPSAIPLDFQYRFDLLKDLVDTYNEIKRLLLLINVECCPNIGAFQKHVMLGRIVENNVYDSLRHQFYKSPIVGHEDENYNRVLFLMDRVSVLVNNYLSSEQGEEIKITPSQLNGDLGQQAIPFYYNVGDNVINNWSFDKTRIFKQRTNLSYHTTNLAALPSIQQPLLFDIDHNNFLRIEGIQGKLYQDALDQVLKLKEDNGLSFDVKVLSINATTQSINLDDYNCEFEDLQVLLKAWTTEQDCILASMASFFSGFTTDEVGGNIRDVDYTEARNPNLIAETAPQEYFRRPGVFKKNIVEDNLTLQENTIGFHVKRAFDENRKGSVNDIKNATISYIGDLVATPEWEAEPAIRDLVIFD
ncbi:MAG: hypothetical protein HRT68_13525, partial [Flavobacteriaceae bacterium]|nr:hypothetical protein [Flavobacteriaceae bacterium]